MAWIRRLGARFPDLWPVLALAVLAGGCSGAGWLSSAFKQVKPSDIEQAPTFSPPAIAEKGLVIGAVASARPDLLTQEASFEMLGSSLRASLLKERPEMKMLMPEDVERALGAEAYQDWSQYFQDTGLIRTERLPEICSALRGSAGYVLVARIEVDRIDQSQSDHHVTKDGRWVTEGDEYTTARTTEMLFRLYDLETSTMEWKGHFETTNRKTNVDDDDEELVFEILDVVFDAEESPYPEPQTIDVQTREIFEAFAETVFGTE